MKIFLFVSILLVTGSLYAQDSIAAATAPKTKHPTYGIDIGGFAYDAHHSGLTIGVLCIGKERNGVTIATLAEVTNKLNGISFSPFLTWADTLNGISINGLLFGGASACDSPPKLVNGLVINGFLSVVRKANALIISPLNAVEKINGVQIGAFNIAHELHGVQFGLINYAKNSIIPWCPIINIGWKTEKS